MAKKGRLSALFLAACAFSFSAPSLAKKAEACQPAKTERACKDKAGCAWHGKACQTKAAAAKHAAKVPAKADKKGKASAPQNAKDAAKTEPATTSPTPSEPPQPAEDPTLPLNDQAPIGGEEDF